MNCNDTEKLLTSYLLGDLRKDVSAKIEAHLKDCDGCRALAREIEPTLDVLRDALAATSSAPVGLSQAHRSRLKEAMTTAPAAVRPKRRRAKVIQWKPAPAGTRILDWFTVQRRSLGVAAAVLLICFALSGVMVPSFVKARHTSQRNASINNLRMIDAAKEQWMLDHNGERPKDLSDLAPYIKGGDLPDSPQKGGFYYYAGKGLKGDVPADQPVAIDAGKDGATVLHEDGSIRWYSKKEFETGVLPKTPYYYRTYAANEDPDVDGWENLAEFKGQAAKKPGEPKESIPEWKTANYTYYAPKLGEKTVAEAPLRNQFETTYEGWWRENSYYERNKKSDAKDGTIRGVYMDTKTMGETPLPRPDKKKSEAFQHEWGRGEGPITKELGSVRSIKSPVLEPVPVEEIEEIPDVTVPAPPPCEVVPAQPPRPPAKPVARQPEEPTRIDYRNQEVAALRSVLKKYPKSREAAEAHRRLEKMGVAIGGGVDADESRSASRTPPAPVPKGGPMKKDGSLVVGRDAGMVKGDDLIVTYAVGGKAGSGTETATRNGGLVVPGKSVRGTTVVSGEDAEMTPSVAKKVVKKKQDEKTPFIGKIPLLGGLTGSRSEAASRPMAPPGDFASAPAAVEAPPSASARGRLANDSFGDARVEGKRKKYQLSPSSPVVFGVPDLDDSKVMDDVTASEDERVQGTLSKASVKELEKKPLPRPPLTDGYWTPGARREAKLKVLGGADNRPRTSQDVVPDAALRAKREITEAGAYLEMAKAAKDLGLRQHAAEQAQLGLDVVSIDAIADKEVPTSVRRKAEALDKQLREYTRAGRLEEAKKTKDELNQFVLEAAVKEAHKFNEKVNGLKTARALPRDPVEKEVSDRTEVRYKADASAAHGKLGAGGGEGDEVMKRLDRIVLPEMDFRQANIHDVLNFISEQSKEHDTGSGKKGADFTFRDADEKAAGGKQKPGADAPLVTMNARNISAADALKIVTEASGLKYRVQDGKVVVVPQNAPEGEMVVRTYDVEPSVMERIKQISGKEKPDEKDFRQFFSRLGAEWPEGASVKRVDSTNGTFLAGTSELLLQADVNRSAKVPPMADWKHKMTISFDGYSEGKELKNFPALVVLDKDMESFDYTGFASANGGDLRFTDANGRELAYEIEKWDPNGKSYAWVKVPEFTDGAKVWCYWGNANAATPAYTTDGSTWKDGGFKGVWHLAEADGVPIVKGPTGTNAYTAIVAGDGEVKMVANKYVPPSPEELSGPRFKAVGVNPFHLAKDRPFSTFAIDVDTASYTVARNYMLKGRLPPAESVRTEEFVNFFDYAYKAPKKSTFKVYAQCAPSKFGRGLHLLKIGVKGKRLGREEQKSAVLTLVIDGSGSMNTPDRMGLVKKSVRMLLENLAPDDKIAIVLFGSRERLVLDHTPASQKQKILAAIDAIQPTGSTNLEQGIRLAYQLAGRSFDGAGVNRVLVMSDGAANLGTDAAEDILANIDAYRRQGIFCSVFGFGIGTYNDEMLETLANKGDGTYSFVDSEEEAERIFADDLGATLNTIAADVKIQVEFTPRAVHRYRQIGYENRQLKKEQFRDDTVDAGEVGSGQSVTALYELELKNAGKAVYDDEVIATVRVRYRRTDNGAVEEIEHPVRLSEVARSFESMDARFRLAAGVAEFAEILRACPHAAGSDYRQVATVLDPVALELSLDRRVQELQRIVSGAGGMVRGEF